MPSIKNFSEAESLFNNKALDAYSIYLPQKYWNELLAQYKISTIIYTAIDLMYGVAVRSISNEMWESLRCEKYHWHSREMLRQSLDTTNSNIVFSWNEKRFQGDFFTELRKDITKSSDGVVINNHYLGPNNQNTQISDKLILGWHNHAASAHGKELEDLLVGLKPLVHNLSTQAMNYIKNYRQIWDQTMAGINNNINL